jgi:hypothetical protein
MRLSAGLLASLYSLSLRLYPDAFQEEYGEEMCTVFELSLKQLTEEGFWAVFCAGWRELRDLPVAVIVAYLRERRRLKMQKWLSHQFVFEPGDWREILLLVMPFLLLAFLPGLLTALPVEGLIPMAAAVVILGTIFLVLALLGIIGFIVKLPLWSMPYAGILLAVLPVVVHAFFMMMGIDKFYMEGLWWLRTAVFLIIYLILMAVLVALVVWLAKKIPFTQNFYDRVRSDWSLLALMCYGGTLVLVLGNYEDVVNGGIYQMMTGVCMLTGAWGYLRIKNITTRVWVLLLGMSGGMLVSLVANIYLLDMPTPPAFFIGSLAVERVVIYVFLTWIASFTMILIPRILNLQATMPKKAT